MTGDVRLVLTVGLLFAGAALYWAAARREPEGETRRDGETGTAVRALAWAAGLWLLASPLWIALWLYGGPPDYSWTCWPYLDKRWLLAAYWTSLFAVVLAPLLVAAAMRIVRRRPRTWRALHRTVADLGPPSGDVPPPAQWRSTALRAACGVLLATLFFGPPWHTDRSTAAIDNHETVHWSGLQAIAHGHTPYLGAASNNYGPGMQLAVYGYMTLSDQFSIPGFRESYAVCLWLALAAVYAATFSVLGFLPALVAALIALFLSPVALWSWTGDGVLTGFWGWANVLRTVGTVVLCLPFAGLVFGHRSRRSLAAGSAALGLLWGILGYYSQENLSSGSIALGLLLGVFYLTATIDLRRAVTSALGLGAGFLTAWMPVVVFYLGHGALGEFWRNYTLVPGRFVRGYANTHYYLANEPMAVAFYSLPFLVTLVAVVALYRLRPLRIAPLDHDRGMVAATAIAFLTAYPASLLRSDEFHLVSTLFALPAVVACALFYLPGLLSRDRSRRFIVRATVVLLAAVVFLPTWQEAPGRLVKLVRGRAASLGPATAVRPFAPADEIERRYGPALAGRRSERATIDLMRRVHQLAGEGKTFVQLGPRGKIKSNPFRFAGHLYFLADLEPAPIWLERSDMVANSDQLAEFFRHFEEHVGEVDQIVSVLANSREIRLFRRAHPGFTRHRLEGPPLPLYVFRKAVPQSAARTSQ